MTNEIENAFNRYETFLGVVENLFAKNVEDVSVERIMSASLGFITSRSAVQSLILEYCEVMESQVLETASALTEEEEGLMESLQALFAVVGEHNNAMHCRTIPIWDSVSWLFPLRCGIDARYNRAKKESEIRLRKIRADLAYIEEWIIAIVNRTEGYSKEN